MAYFLNQYSWLTPFMDTSFLWVVLGMDYANAE